MRIFGSLLDRFEKRSVQLDSLVAEYEVFELGHALKVVHSLRQYNSAVRKYLNCTLSNVNVIPQFVGKLVS